MVCLCVLHFWPPHLFASRCLASDADPCLLGQGFSLPSAHFDVHFAPSAVCILTWDSYHRLYEIRHPHTSHCVSRPWPGVAVLTLFLVPSGPRLVSQSSVGSRDAPRLLNSHTSRCRVIHIPSGLVAKGWKRNLKAKSWGPGGRGSYVSIHCNKVLY